MIILYRIVVNLTGYIVLHVSSITGRQYPTFGNYISYRLVKAKSSYFLSR